MTKISDLPLETAPALSHHLIGNEGGTTTKRPTIDGFLGLHRGPKQFLPVSGGGVYAGDVMPTGSGSASTTAHNNVINWSPLFVPYASIIDTIQCRVQTLEAGAICRLGLYMITSLGTMPVGARVADFGTVDASTTGIKTLSGLAQPVTKGLYALCAAASNHSTVRYRKPETAANFFIYGEAGASSFLGTAGWSDASTDYSGGLPSTITATAAFGGNANSIVEVMVTFA